MFIDILIYIYKNCHCHQSDQCILRAMRGTALIRQRVFRVMIGFVLPPAFGACRHAQKMAELVVQHLLIPTVIFAEASPSDEATSLPRQCGFWFWCD